MTQHDTIIDTLHIALSATAHLPTDTAALHIGNELAAVTGLTQQMCSTVVFAAITSELPQDALVERVTRSLHEPVRV